MIETRIASKEVDILLFLEGTYPFIKGGVSSWVYEIIRLLPEYQFGIIFLGAYEGLYKDYLFPIPDNMVHLQLVYLFENEKQEERVDEVPGNTKAFEEIKKAHELFKNSHGCPSGFVDPIGDVGKMIEPGVGFDFRQFLRSEQSWQFITEQYTKYSTDPSFIDYFWNIRNMHAPLWRLEEAISQVPKAKMLHTISTGYAGMLAAMVHQRYNVPLVLSEHGLYSKERNIELLQTSMFAKVDNLIANKSTFNYQHRLWLNFYDSLARMCYQFADPIVSLFKAAQIQQHAAGADIKKTKVIPNGVDIAKYAAVRRPPEAEIPKIVCFVGRIVRIKDIKTFIRSVAIMVAKDSTITALIKGVGNEDPEYLEECIDYVNLLGLEDKIEFVTEGDMLDVLRSVGLLILTSISEGMPLVLLESLAAGIPVMATSVGACREIIEGNDEEDKALGSCGAVVSITNASNLAEEAVTLLNDRERWLSAREVGIKRVEKYYSQKEMIDSYRKLYGRHRT